MTCIRSEADQVQIERGQNAMYELQSNFNQLAAVLALAGNEVRLKILYLLDQENELCPCDLADILQMSVPAVSQHLRKMRDGGVIHSRKEGKTIYYALKSSMLEILTPLLERIHKPVSKEVAI